MFDEIDQLREVLAEIDRLRLQLRLDEIDRMRSLAALGREIEWEIERWGDPYLMGVRARVEAGDGFTQNEANR